ncbi:MAG: 2OG-Fe(II) oxygenase [Myxococcota bacterium]
MTQGAADERSESARLDARVDRIDWRRAQAQLDTWGYARLGKLLDARQCRRLAGLYDRDASFRKTVSMDAHRFGSGEYRYFDAPLPDVVAHLRRTLYPALARIANDWQERFGRPDRFEPRLPAFLRRCRAEGQARPTPLLLRYRAGGWNNLHQDLYGQVAFPLQVVLLLSRPQRDFTGGEFLLVENRPRQQSRGSALALAQGEALVFPTQERPVEGARGVFRASLRHGMSPLHDGERLALGVIFHDAR